MTDKERLMDEIDSIFGDHLESIGNVFDDLKKATAVDASSSDGEKFNFLHERIDIAQQR